MKSRLPSTAAFVLCACGAAATPTMGTPTTGTEQRTEQATAPPDPCEGRTGLVIEAPDAIVGEWAGGVVVGGAADVPLRWCGEGSVVVDRMSVVGPGGSVQGFEVDPTAGTLEHGRSVALHVLAPALPGELELTAFAHLASGETVTAHASTHGGLPEDFVRERDACAADGGTWGPVGLARSFACDRPTHDAGQRCLSHADCEGPCLDVRVEVTTSPPDGRTCPAGQEVRLHVGTCASHSLLFGCAARLDEVLTECATPGMASRTHTVCVD